MPSSVSVSAAAVPSQAEAAATPRTARRARGAGGAVPPAVRRVRAPTPCADCVRAARTAGRCSSSPSPLDGLRHRLVVSLGFGVDAYHGVNHVQVLENIAALEREGAYLGARCTSTRCHTPRSTPEHTRIVNGSIAAAVRGAFGAAARTRPRSGRPLGTVGRGRPEPNDTP